jgi:hypothetical protein
MKTTPPIQSTRRVVEDPPSRSVASVDEVIGGL